MPSFVDITTGKTPAAAADIQQVIDALKGTAGKGIPLSLTAVNDAINFALSVKNNDTGASKAAIYYKADGTVLLQVDKNGVIASPDGTAAATQLATVTNAQTLTNKTITDAGSSLRPPAVSLQTASNALAADVALNNTALYFDGPSMAQGTSGTWFVVAQVALIDTVAATYKWKLWDGTTVIASGTVTERTASDAISVSASGFLANPAGNIRLSVNDTPAITGLIKFNVTGNGKDSAIYGVRIA